MAIEEKVTEYYSTVAEQSKLLMADVPRAFMLIKKGKEKRLELLKELVAAKD